MKKYKVIANPAAGNGAGARAIPQIEQLLTQHGLDYDLTHTEHAGHAIALARKAALADYAVVVAAGGDGTANEVINGLMAARQEGASEVVMGLLNIGRGNDFAYGMNVPDDLERACRTLAEGHTRTIDIGRVVGGKYPQGRYFGNCVGVGFDAIGTIEVSKLPRLGGFWSFVIAVFKTILLYYHAPPTRVEYDGQTLTQPALMVSVMNGRRLGGGFMMAPQGEPDDGLFDLCIVREMSRLRMFRILPHFLRGTQASQETVTTGQAARITITALQGTLPAHTDGEIICIDGQKLEIELLPRQLDIIGLPPGESP
jgi:YegS/Rv2252/BmrU family lipid kinase